MAPSTFASAAAGNNTTRTPTSGEWSRRPNGATQTFRRPSLATSLSSSNHQRDGSTGQTSNSTSSAGVYVPPHISASRHASNNENRHSKETLLQLYQVAEEREEVTNGLASLYVADWPPNTANGTSSATWGRKDDHTKEHQAGADVCWDRDGVVHPLGLLDMSAEEKEIFSGSVNSPLKPPTQNTGKDGTPKDSAPLRKSSVSQSNSPGAFGLSSPTSTRPGGRRREPSDAYPFPSPSNPSRFSRDDSGPPNPPAALTRRRTDLRDLSTAEERGKEENEDKDKASERENPLGGLKRSTTGGPLSAGLSGPSSPWSTAGGGGFSPMGPFGSFSLGGNAQPSTEKRSAMGSLRGESRFKGLMAKDSSESISTPVKQKSSTSSLGRATEGESDHQIPSWMDDRTNRPTSNETDPFPEEEKASGSAALGGGQDSSPPRQGFLGFDTPNRQISRDPSGFSAFGMTSGPGLRDLLPGGESYSTDTSQGRMRGEPMSPTDTNPYQSPDQDRSDPDEMRANGSDAQRTHLPGLGGFSDQSSAFPGFGGLPRTGSNAFDVADRSQTSSTGPPKGLSGLGGLGGLPGLAGSSAWSTSQPHGTPIRDRTAYGGPLGDGGFGSVSEMQSPSLAGLAGGGLFGAGSIGRGSKMGSLFPAAMQEQMRGGEQNRQPDESLGDDKFMSGLGAASRNAFGAPGVPSRDPEGLPRTSKGLFDDLIGGSLRGSESPFSNRELGAGSPFTQMQQSSTPGTTAQSAHASQRSLPQNMQPQTQGISSPSNQAPPAQQRQMVMPDRMRWIYRDPQGNTQGPWSGLEMHDWYKAGFFTPELLVKKAEDPEYEPLAHLIRRIGNSREPFLVPQIGIPHGPPTAHTGNAWANQGPMGGPPAGTQPPFASSFPSFGTTLTAEQQNALERRKQEEQYLMARQKEHLAQQQVIAKQIQIQGGIMPNQLHHHGSAQSLHSQPSFGSITSPAGYQPSPTQGPVAGSGGVPGFFDNTFRQGPAPGAGSMAPDVLGNIKEEDPTNFLERLNLGRQLQQPFGGQQPFGQSQDSSAHAQQVAAMLNDRARLQREQDQFEQHADANDLQAALAAEERFQQFQDLRSQMDLDVAGPPPEGVIGKPSTAGQYMEDEHEEDYDSQEHDEAPSPTEGVEGTKPYEPLSLTEQVKAASAKQTPAPQSPWGKIDTCLPQPFPPPASSPMPAPVAQRKQNVADNLHAESRSQSQTPSVETPSASIAPWAKEPAEAPRGPSLKEIQEAEAKKAAQQEETAAAARKAQLEKERIAAAAAAASVPAPGLPSSSTWGSGASPITPTASTTSVWAQPLAGKIASQTGPTAKKTLSQIQKEEEARKQRAAAAATAASASAPSPTNPQAAGKRYAELASKNASPATPTAGGAWTTVGASGKPKMPVAPPTGPAAVRSTSTGVPPVAAAAVRASKPSTPARSASGVVGAVNAQEEFKKWAVMELRPDVMKGVSVDDLLSTLLNYPPDTELITEAVHSVTQALDSRHFAEEFIRRRKLADKGVVDTSSHSNSPANDKAGAGGWSEVAKKGPPAKEEVSSFKVVSKKGGRGKR